MTASLTVQIAGTDLPLFRAQISGGSHGSTGHATITSSITALADQGVDLLEISQDAPTIVPVDIFLAQDSGTSHLFGGEYLKANWSFKRDAVSIHARDWSGLLVDQKRVLTNILGGNTGALAPGEVAGDGVSTTNQPLSKMVTAIANQFGLTPDLRLSSAPGSDPEVGTIFGSSTDTILTAVPQSLWGILMRLARDTGNEVYTTPDKHLVFGAPGAGLSPLTFGWMQNPPPAGTLPLMDLNIEHNPRRNLTFRVLVLSYDPTTRQTTKGQAYVIGTNMTTSGGSTVKAGAWSGAQASAIQAQIGAGPKSQKNAIPLYTFHVDGLTAAQANLRAQSIATDIAKRELIVTGSADIVPGMSPSQPVTLDGNIPAGFLSHQYYVTGYTHNFSMPQGGASRQAELDTSFMLLDVQPVGEGTATLTGTAE
jgi:hypothetical protein